MPMVPPLVPSPVLKAARPHKVLAAWFRHRRVAAAPAAALALARVTLPVLVPAPAVVAAETVPEMAAVEVAGPALVLATLPALVLAINLAEAVGTSSRFRGE